MSRGRDRGMAISRRTVLEWGVRALAVPVRVSGERDVSASAKADMFPAYDEDGGLLLVLTPEK